MENTEKKLAEVGEMHKRPVAMADGKRCIIFYTLGEEEKERRDEGIENVGIALEPASRRMDAFSELRAG